MNNPTTYFRSLLVLFILACLVFPAFAQEESTVDTLTDEIKIDGEILKRKIIDGDTFLLASLDEVTMSSPRSFDSYEEYMRYKKYKRYASKVYPYAVKAIRIFKQTEYLTRYMDKRHRRRHVKALQNRLEDEFKEPLKGLTKTQGEILVNMVERKLDRSMHDLIKDLRGGFTATFWTTASFFIGYHLKNGYTEGEDPIMDIVLRDFEIDVGDPPYEEMNY